MRDEVAKLRLQINEGKMQTQVSAKCEVWTHFLEPRIVFPLFAPTHNSLLGRAGAQRRQCTQGEAAIISEERQVL